MALGNNPNSIQEIPQTLKKMKNFSNNKKNTIDLSEMEKENLRVLEDKKNLKENLKKKEER